VKLHSQAKTNHRRPWGHPRVTVVTLCSITATAAIAAVALAGSLPVLGQEQPLGQLFSSASLPVPPRPVTYSFVVTGQDTTLNQLRREGITAYYPAYLPAPLSFDRATRLMSDDPAFHDIDFQLTFRGGWSEKYRVPNFLMIEQFELKEPAQMTIPSGYIIRRLQINGYQAVYYNPGFPTSFPNADTVNNLLVFIDQHEIALSGTAGFEELVKIAQSLTPLP